MKKRISKKQAYLERIWNQKYSQLLLFQKKYGHCRAEQLAHAFNVHPAIILFPEYESEEIRKAA